MGLWRLPDPLVLASKSAARRAMLEQAGIPVTRAPADIDERALEKNAAQTDPAQVALFLACEKARASAHAHPGRIVLGADQTLALGAQRFSKPKDRSAAKTQLDALRGKTHSLHSAFALCRDGEILHRHADAAHLTMRDFSDAFLQSYLDAAEEAVTQSVGAYQLERLGIQLFARIEGDHFTILGMPLLPLLDILRHEKWLTE